MSVFLIFLFLSFFTPGDLEIRIYNDSDFSMENVRVAFPSQTEDFGTVPAQGATDYRRVKESYRLARVEAVVDGKPAIIQPFDYVGEKKAKTRKVHVRIECRRKCQIRVYPAQIEMPSRLRS